MIRVEEGGGGWVVENNQLLQTISVLIKIDETVLVVFLLGEKLFCHFSFVQEF